MKKVQLAGLFAFLLTLPLLATPRGVYFGGSVGQSFIKTEISDIGNEDLKLDGNDFAYKLYAGVRMTTSLAFEGGYKHLGTVKSKASDITFESRIAGYDIAAVGNIYLGIVDLFAKGGVFWWDQQLKGGGEKATNSGSNFVWGFGATLRLGQMGVKAEWERFELADYDRLAMLSLGLVFGL